MKDHLNPFMLLDCVDHLLVFTTVTVQDRLDLMLRHSRDISDHYSTTSHPQKRKVPDSCQLKRQAG